MHTARVLFLAETLSPWHISGMNFSANADPEPELLLAILRQISLIENKQESRRTDLHTGELKCGGGVSID